MAIDYTIAIFNLNKHGIINAISMKAFTKNVVFIKIIHDIKKFRWKQDNFVKNLLKEFKNFDSNSGGGLT